MKKVVVTGGGQLAWELLRTAPEGIECIALPRAKMDIANSEQVAEVLGDITPDIVINAAAYTAVDKAESDESSAYAANADGVANLAKQCQQNNAHLLHVSTDFVFDGQASRPYLEDQAIKPLGVYGKSKAAGEEAIASTMANENWAIIRTAWVYSSHGNNFVKTMLRLMDSKPQLGVVGDQVGSPTWAKGLAEVCWAAAAEKIAGIYHWTDAGVASWYDFAVAIQRIGLEKGLLSKAIPVKGIATEDYPTPAERPSYSVLSKKKLLDALPDVDIVHWQDQLSNMMAELPVDNDC